LLLKCPFLNGKAENLAIKGRLYDDFNILGRTDYKNLP
jgi:hypothetical protein